MTSKYFSSLDYLAQKRYSEKLQVQGVSLPDPYVLGDKVWSCSVPYTYFSHTRMGSFSWPIRVWAARTHPLVRPYAYECPYAYGYISAQYSC